MGFEERWQLLPNYYSRWQSKEQAAFFPCHTGMPLVSRMRLGTWRADSATRIASWMRFTSARLKAWLEAIFRNRITLSSPSLLYWGTHRLSDTSSNASTSKGKHRLGQRLGLRRVLGFLLSERNKKIASPCVCKGKQALSAWVILHWASPLAALAF